MNRAPRPSVPAPIGLSPPGDGIPWLRLVLGMVLLAVSFAVSQQPSRRPTRAIPAAVPQPVFPRSAAGIPLAALEAVEPLAKPASPGSAGASRSPAPAAAPAVREAGTVARSPAKPLRIAAHRMHRRAPHARARRAVLAFPDDRDPWSSGYDQVAAATLTRRRADVRREYIAAREFVAALTGEDSGSAYLARAAARARPRPLGPARHAHRVAT